MDIILASSSPRRKELLEKYGYKFSIKVGEVSEEFSDELSAFFNVKRLGLKKAHAIAKDNPDRIVIGCDTIVVLNNHVFGKPKDDKDAFAMLKALSGKTHQVLSGVAIIYQNDVYNFVVTSNVTFKNLTAEEINEYILTKECFGKAGAYAIQGIGKKLVESYDGELENIIGLPMKEVNQCLKRIMK